MALFTWAGTQGFTYSLDDTLPTIKDQIRSRIGDKDGTPIAYLSDNEIIAIAAAQNNDLFNAAADCAEACAFRVLSLSQEIQQGSARHGLRIKNFDIAKVAAQFMLMADMLRNKSTVGSLPSYGALVGKIQTGPLPLGTGCVGRYAGSNCYPNWQNCGWQSCLNPTWSGW